MDNGEHGDHIVLAQKVVAEKLGHNQDIDFAITLYQ